MSANDNFHWPVDAHSLIAELVAHLGPAADMAFIERVGRMLAERDRAVEDFLNEHVLRKTQSKLWLPTGTSNIGLGVAPSYSIVTDNLGNDIAIPFTKSALRSIIRVEVHGNYIGQRSGGGATSWVAFAVGITDDANTYSVNTIVDTDGRSVNGGQNVVLDLLTYTAGDNIKPVGSNGVVGLLPGKYRAVLVGAVADIFGYITTTANRSVSLSVTESPA